MRPVTIRSRLGESQGEANDEIVIFDRYDLRSKKLVRHFILLEYGVKLMFEPFGWKNEWYADIVRTTFPDEETIEIYDQLIDIVVEGNGPTYRAIDFDDLAERVEANTISSREIGEILRKLQRFLDDHLHRGKDFPPTIIIPHMN
jgi:predicted RNA-binding protein associated with RNAse of E/G family